MNYKQMLDKFAELEKRIKVFENHVRSLEIRIAAMEKPVFKESYKMPADAAWPQEFWPTLYKTTKDTK